MDEVRHGSKCDPTLEQIEREILASVKFIDVILKEIKNKDKELRDGLGMSYAKYIGLTSPFEEAVRCLRKVRGELDSYLKTIRSELSSKYKQQKNSKVKR